MLRSKKFTLIELLVVIAIIGILSSMLLPSLSKARKKAKEALSISNLKQIYTGIVMYVDENDEYVPSPTNFTTGRHWPYYIYESMTGIGFDKVGNVSNYMRDSSYADVMYCPIVKDVRGGESIHPMGRTDYGMNNFFNKNNGGYKKFSRADGNIEPLLVPIQNPSNPEIWSTNLAASDKNAAYYYSNNKKTLGLYIHGNVTHLSIAYGASINSKIANGSAME